MWREKIRGCHNSLNPRNSEYNNPNIIDEIAKDHQDVYQLGTITAFEIPAQKQAYCQQDQTIPDIPEDQTEEQREYERNDKRRINLRVSRSRIDIDDQFGRPGKRGVIILNRDRIVFQVNRNFGYVTFPTSYLINRPGQGFNFIYRDPAFRNKCLVCRRETERGFCL